MAKKKAAKIAPLAEAQAHLNRAAQSLELAMLRLMATKGASLNEKLRKAHSLTVAVLGEIGRHSTKKRGS